MQEKSADDMIHDIYLEKRHKLVLQNLPRVKPIKLLDVGCGDGMHSLEYARMLTDKSHVVAFDIIYYPSWKMIRKNAPIDFLVADANSLPFSECSFDIVTMTEVLEHMDNDVAYLQSIDRILKDEGTLIITTPNGARVTSVLSRISIFLKKLTGRKLRPIEHRREYSLFELRRVLSKGGFRLQKHSYVSFCPYLPIFRIMSQKDALSLFYLFDRALLADPFASLFRWGLVAVTNTREL